MTTLDYFLYDNRTWASRIGRDWGIKAATGILASRSDLRSAFDRYCGALPSEHGYLCGFSQALGGIRPPHGDGYLLCVTVETTDPFGRPSWAIYGLWCPNNITLENTLAGNPIGAAQATLGAESPPPVIELSSFGLASLPVSRRHGEKTVCRRFDGTSSVSEAISLLLGAIRRKTPLPNVLGITASSRLPELGRQFDVIYSHPLNDRSERALEQCRNEEPFVIVERETTASAPASRSPGQTAIVWAASLAAAAAIVIAFRWPQRMVFYGARAESPAEIALHEIQAQMAGVKALDPEDLRNIAQKEGRRTAYADLIQARKRIVNVSEESQARSLDPDARLQQIRFILNEHPLGGDACRAVEMTNPTVRQWCESLARVERTAHADFSQRTIP